MWTWFILVEWKWKENDFSLVWQYWCLLSSNFNADAVSTHYRQLSKSLQRRDIEKYSPDYSFSPRDWGCTTLDIQYVSNQMETQLITILLKHIRDWKTQGRQIDSVSNYPRGKNLPFGIIEFVHLFPFLVALFSFLICVVHASV